MNIDKDRLKAKNSLFGERYSLNKEQMSEIVREIERVAVKLIDESESKKLIEAIKSKGWVQVGGCCNFYQFIEGKRVILEISANDVVVSCKEIEYVWENLNLENKSIKLVLFLIGRSINRIKDKIHSSSEINMVGE